MSLHLLKEPLPNMENNAKNSKLNIKTFDNETGPCCFFKALGHVEVQGKRAELADKLRQHGNFALYDVDGIVAEFLDLCELKPHEVGEIYTLKTELLGQEALPGKKYQPITQVDSDQLLILSFDHEPFSSQIRHVVPEGCEISSLAELRLPEKMLSNTRNYLSGINFATNFAFFRDEQGYHTRITTANYWKRYGAKHVSIYLYLMNNQGKVIAKWSEDIPDSNHVICIDSQDVKTRFGLDDFCGQLFIHVTGVNGHEIVKYALDTYGDSQEVLSATHDANAWPADYFAGLPAPREDEEVVLWVQNTHPITIKPGSITINGMGEKDKFAIKEEISPFATLAVSVRDIIPHAKWPQQLEINSGKYLCRPRYEVIQNNKRRCIAHVNVERTDLQDNPSLTKLNEHIGKGFLLPAPILPTGVFNSYMLVTPMATSQKELPLRLHIYNRHGEELLQQEVGILKRNHQNAINLSQLATGMIAADDYGHVELTYGSALAGQRDGWLHAHFRYQDVDSSHMAETSFGSHIFNNIMTYKNEPQSYGGRPPGVTTRLFLRLGHDLGDTYMYLIYPVSKDWHAFSRTQLELYDQQGELIAEKIIQIPKNGSRRVHIQSLFSKNELSQNPGYVIIDDRTCRLFGYHIIKRGNAFSLDHMFGF